MVDDRLNDISLILAKAKRAGFFEDVSSSEVDFLTQETSKIFGSDAVFDNVFLKGVRERSLAAGGPAQNWYRTARYGLFSHFTYGGPSKQQTIYANGTVPTSVDELANSFDVNRYVKDAVAFGVEYVTITAWHFAMYALYPSTVLNSTIPGHSATRDVIQELIAALKPTGIKLMLYVHPIDGLDLQAAEQTATGWNDATNNYEVWGNFINNLLTELGTRYGTGIDGIWVDMVQDPNFTIRISDKNRFWASVRAGHASRVIVGNAASDNNFTSVGSGVVDYSSREYIGSRPASILDWTPSYNQTVIFGTNTNEWWAKKVAGTGSALAFPATDMFRFSVLQAGANTFGGGMAWNMSPYAGTSASIWEDGIEQGMKAISDLTAPLLKSLRNVISSGAYVTKNTVTLNTLTDGFVATRSSDSRLEYIHVLNPPAGSGYFTIPAPKDGSVFVSARNLVTGNTVALSATSSKGYTLTLNSNDSWSAIDTVIELTRESKRGERMFIDATQFTTPATGTTATFLPQGGGSRFPAWSMDPAISTQIQAAFVVPAHWRGYAVDLYWTQIAAGTGDMQVVPTRSEVSEGSLLTVGDEPGGTLTFAMPGVQQQVVISNIFPVLYNTALSINHIRISRFGSSGADTGPTSAFLGIVLRRLQ